MFLEKTSIKFDVVNILIKRNLEIKTDFKLELLIIIKNSL